MRRWWFVFLSLAGDCFWAETRHIALLLVRDLCPFSLTPHLTHLTSSSNTASLNTDKVTVQCRLCCIKMLMISDNIPPESHILLWQICGRFTGISDWFRSGQVMRVWASIGWCGSGWQMCRRGERYHSQIFNESSRYHWTGHCHSALLQQQYRAITQQ